MARRACTCDGQNKAKLHAVCEPSSVVGDLLTIFGSPSGRLYFAQPATARATSQQALLELRAASKFECKGCVPGLRDAGSRSTPSERPYL